MKNPKKSGQSTSDAREEFNLLFQARKLVVDEFITYHRNKRSKSEITGKKHTSVDLNTYTASQIEDELFMFITSYKDLTSEQEKCFTSKGLSAVWNFYTQKCTQENEIGTDNDYLKTEITRIIQETMVKEICSTYIDSNSSTGTSPSNKHSITPEQKKDLKKDAFATLTKKINELVGAKEYQTAINLCDSVSKTPLGTDFRKGAFREEGVCKIFAKTGLVSTKFKQKCDKIKNILEEMQAVAENSSTRNCFCFFRPKTPQQLQVKLNNIEYYGVKFANDKPPAEAKGAVDNPLHHQVTSL